MSSPPCRRTSCCLFNANLQLVDTVFRKYRAGQTDRRAQRAAENQVSFCFIVLLNSASMSSIAMYINIRVLSFVNFERFILFAIILSTLYNFCQAFIRYLEVRKMFGKHVAT